MEIQILIRLEEEGVGLTKENMRFITLLKMESTVMVMLKEEESIVLTYQLLLGRK